jgi:hypothetical protein
MRAPESAGGPGVQAQGTRDHAFHIVRDADTVSCAPGVVICVDDERRAGRPRAHGRRDRGVVRTSSEGVRGAGERAVRGAQRATRSRRRRALQAVAAGESAVRACE